VILVIILHWVMIQFLKQSLTTNPTSDPRLVFLEPIVVYRDGESP